MYREMEEAGLPEPEYKAVVFMVHATKYLVDAKATNNQNVAQDVAQGVAQNVVQENTKPLLK